MPDFIASAPIFTPFPQGLARLVSVVGDAGGGDNQLTAIPITVGQGSGMGVMTPSLLVARGMMVAASGLLPEGVVKLISGCEIVIANRDIMISRRETVISNPETKM